MRLKLKKQFWVFLFWNVYFLLTACAPQAPAETAAVIYTARMCEQPTGFEIHSFHTEGTDVTFVFEGDKALLIDCSTVADSGLIEAYLRAHGVSHLDYVIDSQWPPYALPSRAFVGTVYAPVSGDGYGQEVQEILPGTGVSLHKGGVKFVESETGLNVDIVYEKEILTLSLQTSESAEATAENAMVTVMKPAPDGTNVGMTCKPLRESVVRQKKDA